MHHPGGYISYKMNKIVSHCYTEIGYFPDCFIEKIVLNFLKKEKNHCFILIGQGQGKGLWRKEMRTGTLSQEVTGHFHIMSQRPI